MNVTPLYGESQANTARTLIGGQAIGENRNDLLRQVLVATANKVSGGGAAWGAITGTLSSQTDLQTALNAKLGLSGGTMTGDLTTKAAGLLIPGVVSGTVTLQAPAVAGAPTITLPSVTSTLATLGSNGFSGAQSITAGSLTSSALAVTQTWNNAGVTCRGLEYAVTNTNSASDSTLFRLLGGAAGATAKLAVTQDARVCAEVGGAFPQFTGLGRTGTGMRIAADRVDFWLSGSALMTVQAGAILLDGGQNIIFGTGGSTFTHSANVMSLINTTTAQKFRVFKTNSGSQYIELDATGTNLINTTYALGNGAASSTGTITNAPAVGNPTKWIPINDNGTTRHIPAW